MLDLSLQTLKKERKVSNNKHKRLTSLSLFKPLLPGEILGSALALNGSMSSLQVYMYAIMVLTTCGPSMTLTISLTCTVF